MSNESLCLEDLATLNEIHKILKTEYRNQIKPNVLKGFSRKMAVQLTQSKNDGTKVQLHKHLAEHLKSFYMEDAKTIDREYFGEPIFEQSLIDYTSKLSKASKHFKSINTYQKRTFGISSVGLLLRPIMAKSLNYSWN